MTYSRWISKQKVRATGIYRESALMVVVVACVGGCLAADWRGDDDDEPGRLTFGGQEGV